SRTVTVFPSRRSNKVWGGCGEGRVPVFQQRRVTPTRLARGEDGGRAAATHQELPRQCTYSGTTSSTRQSSSLTTSTTPSTWLARRTRVWARLRRSTVPHRVTIPSSTDRAGGSPPTGWREIGRAHV